MKDPIILENNTIIKHPRKQHTYITTFGMAFVTSDNKQITAFTSCRDYLHDEIRTFLNKKTRVKDDGHPYHPDAGDPDIYMEELRLLIMLVPYSKDNFLHALKVLNMLEQKSKMSLTVAELINTTDKQSETYIFLKGSKEYMYNPHLLSALTLILRFCTFNPVFKVTDEHCLINGYKSIQGNIQRDNHIMPSCYKYIHNIMKTRKSLFKNIELKELFPVDITYNFHSKGGISNLCIKNSPIKEVNKRMAKLIKETKHIQE